MLEKTLLDASTKLVKSMEEKVSENMPEKLSKIIKFHSKGAALSALASAWLPGVGAAAALVACGGFTWGMYLRINNELNLSISSNILKTLAGGVMTNLGTYAAGLLVGTAVSGVISFIPIIGSVGASIIMSTACYVLTTIAGIIYLNLMTELFKAGKNPSHLSASKLKDYAAEIIEGLDIDTLIDEAKQAFQEAKDSGEFDNPEEDGFVICKNCGEEVPLGEPACPNCGCKIDNDD